MILLQLKMWQIVLNFILLLHYQFIVIQLHLKPIELIFMKIIKQILYFHSTT
jgi:hypothetical protein